MSLQGIPVQVAPPVFQVPSVHFGVALGDNPAGHVTAQRVPCTTGGVVQVAGTDAPALNEIPGAHGAAVCITNK